MSLCFGLLGGDTEKGVRHLILREGVLQALVTPRVVSFKAAHQTMLEQNYLKSRVECARLKKKSSFSRSLAPKLKT